MKVIIIGGVAAGLSAASQIKRQAPDSQVVVLEKCGDLSYAACGMPYNLFFRDTPVESLYALTYDAIIDGRKVDYRRRNEVMAIDSTGQTVRIIDHENGREYEEGYDFLVYATGNRPIRLDRPGFDNDVFHFKTLDDTRRIKAFLYERAPKSVLLIGAGYTNLELTDVLSNMKVQPVIVEKTPAVLPAFSAAVREKVEEKLREKGIDYHTGVDVYEKNGSVVKTSAGDISTDFVVTLLGFYQTLSFWRQQAANWALHLPQRSIDIFAPTFGMFLPRATARSTMFANLSEIPICRWGRLPTNRDGLQASIFSIPITCGNSPGSIRQLFSNSLILPLAQRV